MRPLPSAPSAICPVVGRPPLKGLDLGSIPRWRTKIDVVGSCRTYRSPVAAHPTVLPEFLLWQGTVFPQVVL